MTGVSTVSRPARASRGVLRRRAHRLQRDVSLELQVALVLGAVAAVIVVLTAARPASVPFTLLSIPLVLGSILLGPRTLPWFVIYTMVMVTLALGQQESMSGRIVGAAVVQFVLGLIVLLASFRRSSLGVAGLRGESMFVDLRDRILSQGGIPALPERWVVESALQSAGGTAFAGDFVVAARSLDGRSLQVVVVDVSGKGEEAGTRALLLSGAFGGLLGALPREQFLSAANEYLIRQDWAEGFATAVHLWLDLDTGAYEVRSAGHPPAVHRHAGAGRWSVAQAEGPLLGLIEDVSYPCQAGVIAPGDAVLLYTDGMVEEPRRDIDLGIDRLLGEAESLLRGSFVGAADRMTRALGSRHDDRAMLVVHRR